MAIVESSVSFESFLKPLMVRGPILAVKYIRDDQTFNPKEAFEFIDSDENITDLEVFVSTNLDIVTLSKFARMLEGKSVKPKRGTLVRKFKRPTSKKLKFNNKIYSRKVKCFTLTLEVAVINIDILNQII